ncbi:hypothetical protein [Limosilactobacillus mucosae]|uniref:hypothetical protein n=1 Tax=Limosilactobacillus mucosae TaxID=97478 RepID=UPI0022E5B23D|nr:hypothetical protein [Limosilactobacillus mucosae]
MNNVTRINWIVLAYLAIWCWVDGFTMTAFGLTVLVLTEALWKPFIKSKLAIKLFGADTMAEVLGQQKSATSRH